MPLLPLFNKDEFIDAANLRLNFLKNFSAKAEKLIKNEQFLSDDAVNKKPWLLPSVTALTEAAAIAFASNQTQIGLELIDNALSKIVSDESKFSHFARMAFLTAIRGRYRTILNQDGPILRFRDSSQSQQFSWEASSNVMRAASGTIVAAALASDEPKKNFMILSRVEDSGEKTNLARIAVTLASETATLPLFGISRDTDGFLTKKSPEKSEVILAFMSFYSLHERYAASMRLNMSDKRRWSQLRCRAPLIDWPLLLLHLAIRRQRLGPYFHGIPFDMYFEPFFPLKFENAGLAGRLFIFLKSLAEAIDKQISR